MILMTMTVTMAWIMITLIIAIMAIVTILPIVILVPYATTM